ncbi:MAG: sigma-70 family RNA polymerase sigma factor [Proteobacteria bacterium]|nr:sigma-70 family RNA polymerase sigma factor [Pseudomonadota bacterium]
METDPDSYPSVPASGGESAFQLPEGFQDDATPALVKKAQAGDVGALNELFERYHQRMVEVARRKLGPRLRLKEDPDDLAQTTFREATRDFQQYRYQGEGSLLRWLVQILHNKIRDKAEFYSAGKRDLSRERAIESSDSGASGSSMRDFPSSDLSVTQAVSREENFRMLRESLEDLSAEHRTAITLVFFEGLSLRDAGERMGGRSEDAVRMMLRRAESKLGNRLRASLGKDL